ncbi:hypothetical protein V9T40_011932 [Parthenolecanium corni]|uniref:HECT-type E3 ubiquitin transferase n=1 Tax=Parthenolecanium corni TaxID=536013 RepID=A0AAN9TM70_9HEMI
MINSHSVFLCCTLAVVIFSIFYCSFYKCLPTIPESERSEVDQWIIDNNLEAFRAFFEKRGYSKLVHYASVEDFVDFNITEEDCIKRASFALKQKLILSQWLKTLGLFQHYQKLLREEVNSLEDVYWLDDGKAHALLGNEFAAWSRGRQRLPATKETLEMLKADLWGDLVKSEQFSGSAENISYSGCVLLLFTSFAIIIALLYKQKFWFAIRSDSSILHVLTGRYLDPSICSVSFTWQDPYPVGETLSFTIKFFQRNGLPYPVCDKDHVQVEISCGLRKISCVLALGGTAPEDANVGTVKFTVRYAGDYQISVLIKNVPIRSSPFVKTFLPGPVDPHKTKFERQSSIVICRVEKACSLMIQPRDLFDNLCLTTSSISFECSKYVDLESYSSIVKQEGKERLDICFQSFDWDGKSSKVAFEMCFLQEGWFEVEVLYKGVVLQNGNLTCVVLNNAEYELTTRNVKNRSASYEVRLTRIEGEPPFKPKKVILFISPKQLTIKEHILKFLLKRIVTFRLCPTTKFQLLEETANGIPSFSVEDGSQPVVYLAAHNRNVIAASFTKFLLSNIGGSETFTEKQYFFYYEVRRFHLKHKHEPITIKINRQNLLKSSLKATKNFSLKEWCNNFEIVFIGEQGVDWGGLRKEWFQLTCEALFGPSNGLFKPFNDNPQALIHPNKDRLLNMKLKYYEFAGRILGKCLYESALGGSYSQFVTARFTRSFLAQLIGLRINHKYFQSDDPDLYLNKVKYILEHDVSSMDLYFVDEEYNQCGQLQKVVELISNGAKIKVTNSSKRQYLDALAQYRLSIRVKDEIETFLRGLNDIIPDHLLSIFDENELELLLCGTGEYSITDFRAHHLINTPYPPTDEFSRVLKWFWIAVSNFTKEEMARLLQFTTGSSQLPPGGFKDLNPQFQIMPAMSSGNLPTAHTCFNQLCLPEYDSYEQFEKSLILAITEGSEGFGLV